MTTTPAPTTSIHILAARQRVAALRAELENPSPAHQPGTYWYDSRAQELALSEQRLARVEALEPAIL